MTTSNSNQMNLLELNAADLSPEYVQGFLFVEVIHEKGIK